MEHYDPKKIEKKWQDAWEKAGIHKAKTGDTKHKKFYSLETFPYPSAAGLHVGHPEGYTAEDINARYQRMNGKNVLYTMGWDAFGLPTENYAIKVGRNPKEVAKENIENFRRQVKMFGFSYDWDREINTSDPEYYKWTQWIFLKFFEKGLAYRKDAPVNWCESCKTVLAREQVIEGNCERCHSPVIQKQMEQWFFKTTNYAEELLSGLENLDWPESTKQGQRNWIGRSEGSSLSFPIVNSGKTIEVFTTRPDTLYGATYMVLSPEHPLVGELEFENGNEVKEYVKQAQTKTELERSHLEKEKTGVELQGVMCVNPATGEEIPVWIADYVLMGYGTGAIMAVPAHDERDHLFAEKYKLEIREVIEKPSDFKGEVYTGDGVMINSGKFDGLDSLEAKSKITKKVKGKKQIQYRLRDWLVSRQRYWGTPIPIIWCESCGPIPVPEDDLPVMLPDDVDFKPTGEPPLASSPSFQSVKCPKCGGNARRDYETMDTFVDSSWYFLRYCSPRETKTPFNKSEVDYWMPVDLYVIGAEHVVLHLLYARFFTKAFADMKLLKTREPFHKMRHIGLILGEDGQKMSKSRGNVVNPDEVVEVHGADSVRLFEMFMGPLQDMKPWSTDSIKGVRRFLDKVWRLSEGVKENAISHDYQQKLHQTIKKVTEDVENMHLNTAIAHMMTMVNVWQKSDAINRKDFEKFLKLLHPFAPHLTEELWHKLGNDGFLVEQSWPEYDEKLTKEEKFELVVQVNGKVREKHVVNSGLSDKELKEIALSGERVKLLLDNQEPKKVIVVKGKLVSIVL